LTIGYQTLEESVLKNFLGLIHIYSLKLGRGNYGLKPTMPYTDLTTTKKYDNMTLPAKIQKKIREQKVKRYYKKKSALKKRRENQYAVSNVKELFYSPCIYFLYFGGKIVYIGETISLMQRISQHVNDGVKEFDSFTFEVIEGSGVQRKHRESCLIRKHKPKYNKVHLKR
jgi:hypothetical protein